MMTGTDALTPQQLLETLRAHGVHVTLQQLHRWQREELIPRPRQRGLGRAAGSESFYSERALLHVRRAAELLSKNRSIGRVGWQLWFEGFEVHEKHWRPHFETALRQFDWCQKIARRMLRADEHNIFNPTIFDRLTVSDKFKRLFSLTWSHSTFDQRASFLRIISDACFSDEPPLAGYDLDVTDGDRRALVKISGISNSTSQAVFSRRLNLAAQVKPMLVALSTTLKADLRPAWHDADFLIDLNDARDYLREASRTAIQFHESTAWVFGRGAFGLRLLRKLLDALPSTSAFMILLWRQLAKESGSEFIPESALQDLRRTTDRLVADSEQLRLLSKTGVFRQILTPSRFRKALKSSEKFEVWLSELRAIRAAM